MPFITTQLLDQLLQKVLTDLFVAIFVIFALSFIPASFLVFIIEERSTNFKQLQFVSGVKPYIYWTSNFIWDLVNYIVPIFICLSAFLLFKVETYTTRQNFPCLILLMLLYGWAVIPLMYPLSYLFKTPSTAFVVASSMNVFLGVVTTMTTTIIDQLDDENLANINNMLKSFFSVLFPHYGLGQGFIQMATLYGKSKVNSLLGESVDYNPFEYDKVGRNLLAMSCQGAAYFILNMLIQYRFFVRFKPKQDVRKLKLPKVQNKNLEEEDEDVLAEKKRILDIRQMDREHKQQNGFLNRKVEDSVKGFLQELPSKYRERKSNENNKDYIKLINLTKVYRKFKKLKFKKHVAVNQLSIGIDKGECFGLIGVNGAGNLCKFF